MSDNELSFNRFSGLVLKHGIDLVKREVYLQGPVSMNMLKRLDKALKLLEIQPEDITVTINTQGGDIEAAFGIIDRIRTSSSAIHTVGTGVVMSAGIPILASGATRKATKYTRFMYHCPSSSLPLLRVSNIDAEVKYTKELGRVMDKLLSETTSKPYSFWVSIGKHVDHNFNSENALSYGLIDEVI